MSLTESIEVRLERIKTVGTNPTHAILPLVKWYKECYEISTEEAIEAITCVLETARISLDELYKKENG